MRWINSAWLARLALIGALPAFFCYFAISAEPRSASARAEFTRTHPCPATGKPRGVCSGYVVDHVVSLCAGGADAPANMQWQTVEEAKIKDAQERRQCAAMKRNTAP